VGVFWPVFGAWKRLGNSPNIAPEKIKIVGNLEKKSKNIFVNIRVISKKMLQRHSLY